MLCQFTFKNFKSYKNETTLDLQAVSSQGFDSSLLQNANDDKRFLPVSVIYGPNGGGKSNVIEALKCVLSLVVVPILVVRNKITEGVDVQWSPFLFDDYSRKEPTEFELFFRPNDEYEYRYIIKMLNEQITEESLYRRKLSPKARIVSVFERNENNIKLGACIGKSSVNTEINIQIPYLSFLAINYNLEPINLAVEWFEDCINRNYANSRTERHLIITSGDEFKSTLIRFMNNIGINISDFKFVEKSAENKSYDVIFEHTVDGKTYELDFKDESDGTQKLFVVLPLVMLALSDGRLLAFDELDAKLHPKLLKFIIMLFKNPNINTENAQLIFTSHDVSTLKSSVFRTDEVWFACKLEDESSDLYSLYDIRDENNNHIQPSAAFDKQYLEGRYGADPYFHNMLDWK